MYKKILACMCSVVLITTTLTSINASAVAPSVYTEFSDITAMGSTEKVPVLPLTPDDELIAQNANLEMYVNKKTPNILVKVKSSGYIWSGIARGDNFQNMSPELVDFAQSLLVCNYSTPEGVIKTEYMPVDAVTPPVFTPIENGIEVLVTFTDAAIKAKFSVVLTETGIVFSLKDENIVNTGENLLTSFQVMPFFGSTYADQISGYMFIPDGSGAVINYSTPRPYSNMYSERIYGEDLSVTKVNEADEGENVVPPQQIYMPIFGAVHGEYQNAFMGNVSSGAEYCIINASPAGHKINFNWMCPEFIYYPTYWQPTSGSNGFNTVATAPNVVNAEVEYYLLDGKSASYSGMAVTYRNKLIENGVLTKKQPVTTDIPIKLDAIMSESKKVTIGTRDVALTTAADLLSWQDQLHEAGLNNVILTTKGFQKNGLSASDIDDFNVSSKVGGEDEFSQVAAKSVEYGGTFGLQFNLTGAYDEQMSDKNTIHHINGEFTTYNVDKPLYNQIVYQNNSSINEFTDVLIEEPLCQNMAMDEMGYILYSDYDNGVAELTRTQAIASTAETLKKLQENTDTLLLESPNQYAWQYSDMIYNTPDTNSKLIFESQSIPFYQIVLSGCVDMFSPYLNYNSGSVDDQLKMIDYNMYPSYIMTGEYASMFTDTNTNDVYASRFDDWKVDMIADYKYVNEVLKNVQGKSVTSREVLATNVVKNTYDDNSYIIINYTPLEYKNNNITVAAKTAKYFEGA